MKRGSVIFGSFAGLFFSYSPFWAHIQGVLIKDISSDLGFSRTRISSAFALSMLATVVMFPIVGRLIDVFGPKRVILTGCCLFPLVLVGFASVPNSYLVFCLIAVAAGLAGAMVTPVTYLSVLPQWFGARLGMALGLASMGVALGQAIMPIVTHNLAAALTWRGAYLVLALILVVFAVPNAIFMVRDNGGLRKARPAGGAPLPGLTLREAVRTALFWQLAASFVLMVAVTSGVTVHMIPYLTDRGVDRGDATLTLFIIGMSSLAARGIAGFLLDRVRVSHIGFGFFAGAAVGLVLLGLAPPSLATAYGAGVLIGAAAGAEGDIMAFVIRRKFGMLAYGNIFGVMFATFSLGPIVGPVLMALSFDRLGSYQPAMLGFAGASLLAAALMLGVEVLTSEAVQDDPPVMATSPPPTAIGLP